VNRHEPAGDEVQLWIVEARKERPHVVRGEHLQVGRIVFRLSSGQETQPVLQTVGVRNRRDELAAGPQHAPSLCDETAGIAKVLEQLAGDDDVEARTLERERLVEVGPARLDTELLRFRQCLLVCVDADYLVPFGVGARQGAVAAAQVEHAPPRAADMPPEELDAFGACEDEAGASLEPVVLRIALA